MKKILLTGGAGYIGSVTVKKLLDLGHQVTVIDNLQKGLKELVDDRAIFHKIDILDLKKMENKLKDQNFDVLMHFAALKDAGQSMKDPELYYNNITGLMNLLKIAPQLKIKQIIFSSSAAVYGNPKSKIVDENHACDPTNFYGYTKLIGEQLLEWNKKINGINYVALRYFNVAGDGGLKYIDPNAKNIFNVIAEVLTKRKKCLDIFGNDYDTKDGTGVRDYIHVSDIADAHIDALKIKESEIINLGSEKGYSVLEILNEFEKQSGQKIPFKIIKRRDGDVAKLIASSKKAKSILNWQAKFDLKEMVSSTIEAYKIA